MPKDILTFFLKCWLIAVINNYLWSGPNGASVKLKYFLEVHRIALCKPPMTIKYYYLIQSVGGNCRQKIILHFYNGYFYCILNADEDMTSTKNSPNAGASFSVLFGFLTNCSTFDASAVRRAWHDSHVTFYIAIGAATQTHRNLLFRINATST